MPKSRRSIRIQYNSAVVEAKARYSASVEERDTVPCFLADQEMGEFPKKMTIPVRERLSIGSPAQSESLYADKEIGPGVKAIPKCKVP